MEPTRVSEVEVHHGLLLWSICLVLNSTALNGLAYGDLSFLEPFVLLDLHTAEVVEVLGLATGGGAWVTPHDTNLVPPLVDNQTSASPVFLQ